MCRVAVAVQVTNGDGVDSLALQFLAPRRYRRIAERRLDATVRSNPLLHAEPPVPGHQRLRRCDAKVVAVVLQAFAHLQDIEVAFGGEQADASTPAFEQSVGCDGRPMDDTLGLFEHGGERYP